MSDERPSMPSAAAIAAAPELSVANAPDGSIVGVEHYEPPPVAARSTFELIRSANVPEAVVRDAINWAQAETTTPSGGWDGVLYEFEDKADRAAAEAELAPLWGDSYEANARAIDTYLDGVVEPAAAVTIRQARDQDGHLLALKPAVLQRLLGEAKNAPALTPGADTSTHIREIEAFMRSNGAAYVRNEPLQARLRELYALRAESGSRG